MEKQIALHLADFNAASNNHTSKIWPIWSDSVLSEVTFSPIPKAQRNSLWYKARKWDQNTRSARKHGGIIGRTALAIYHTLLWDFLNLRTGRLDPTVETIARAASCSARAAHTALQHLKSLKLINWTRRCERSHDENGRFVLRQRSNAYQPASSRQWLGYRELEQPEPDRATLGFPSPAPHPLDLAVAGVLAGDRMTIRQALAQEPDDPLACALAALGRTLGAV